MLSKFRESHPIWFCLGAAVVFMVFGFALSFLLSFIPYFAKEDLTASQVMVIVTEGLSTLLMMLVLQRIHRAELLTRRGSSFKNCLLVALCPLILSILSLMVQLFVAAEGNAQLRPWDGIVTYVVSMMMVGVSEELMARAAIAETLLEHFGTDSLKNVWKSTVISALIFGLLHLTNMLSVNSVKGVLIQAMSAFTGGILYAAIYYRTGNIWVTVLLHGLNDVVAGLGAGVFTYEASVASGIESLGDADWNVLVLPAIEALAGIYLLRKKKLPQLQRCWTGLVDSKEVSEKE